MTMKRKRFEGGHRNGEENRPAPANSEGKEWKRKNDGSNKRGKSLGGGRGGGLSLEAFATAKSKQQARFPSQIRERREFYSNAKIVQKYKKLQKQRDPQDQAVLPKDSTPPSDGHIIERGDGALSDRLHSDKSKAVESKRKKPWALRKGERIKSHRRKPQEKGLSQIERIRKEKEEKDKERDRQRQEKEEERAQQQEAKEKAQRDRKEVQAKLRKKTSRGQPVMKHQMERLLGAIQRQS